MPAANCSLAAVIGTRSDADGEKTAQARHLTLPQNVSVNFPTVGIGEAKT